MLSSDDSRLDSAVGQASSSWQPQRSRSYEREQRIAFWKKVAAILGLMLIVRFLLPVVAEELQYAVTRGRQRAEYELAGQHLDRSPLRQISAASQSISRRAAPSVVHIETTTTHVSLAPHRSTDLRRLQLDAPPLDDDVLGHQGSGVIVDARGFVVTNHHVIKDAESIAVTLSDGRRVTALPVGVDRLTDLALLKIEASELTAAEWGDSDQISEGAFVWAVGSPFGLQHSVTCGIVSAKNRSGNLGTAYQEFLQTDAAVNPGNSGGPLVDSHGRVIGINTMIVGATYRGVSLAIPSNVARRICQQLQANGRVARGWLGVSLAAVPDRFIKSWNLSSGGALISSLLGDQPLSPALQAGLQAGDIIVRWNDQPIKSTSQLSRVIAESSVGSRARVHVVRDGEQLTTDVRVGTRPEDWN